MNLQYHYFTMANKYDYKQLWKNTISLSPIPYHYFAKASHQSLIKTQPQFIKPWERAACQRYKNASSKPSVGKPAEQRQAWSFQPSVKQKGQEKGMMGRQTRQKESDRSKLKTARYFSHFPSTSGVRIW